MFTPEISRSNFKELLIAARGYGFTQIQLDLSSTVFGETMPEKIDPRRAKQIADEANSQNIEIAAITGTFNMAHPEPKKRSEGLNRLREMIESCKYFGTSLVTLCTGSRNMGNPFDIYNMWIPHPDNNTPQAWKDMYITIEEALGYAESNHIYLGIEPEPATVVDYPSKARKLIDDLGSSRLKVIMDCANLFHEGEASRMQEVLKEAFELIGNDIILAHGKDLAAETGEYDSPFAPFASPGKGIIDYDTFIKLLYKYDYKGGIILHGFKKEEDISEGVEILRQKIAKHISQD